MPMLITTHTNILYDRIREFSLSSVLEAKCHFVSQSYRYGIVNCYIGLYNTVFRRFLS